MLLQKYIEFNLNAEKNIILQTLLFYYSYSFAEYTDYIHNLFFYIWALSV